jgi:DNA-binding FrmR family transcriptional regulator|nr:MAG: hypothetical protein KatS3mg041_0615 [Bacteroidota bacterium]
MKQKAEQLTLSHIEDRKEILRRLARIEGQIRALQRLIQEEADCATIIQQMMAARQAVHKTFAELMARLLTRECLLTEHLSEEERQNLGHLADLIRRYL